jgi:hypothetical protein
MVSLPNDTESKLHVFLQEEVGSWNRFALLDEKQRFAPTSKMSPSPASCISATAQLNTATNECLRHLDSPPQTAHSNTAQMLAK